MKHDGMGCINEQPPALVELTAWKCSCSSSYHKFFLIGVVKLGDMHSSSFIETSCSREVLRVDHQLDGASLALIKRFKALV